jgi:hypothetical protein
MVIRFGRFRGRELERRLKSVVLPTAVLSIQCDAAIQKYPCWDFSTVRWFGKLPILQAACFFVHCYQEESLAPLWDPIARSVQNRVARFVTNFLKVPGNNPPMIHTTFVRVGVIRVWLIEKLWYIFHQDCDGFQSFNKGQIVVIQLVPRFFQVGEWAVCKTVLDFRNSE